MSLCGALRKDKTLKLNTKVIKLGEENDKQPEDLSSVERALTWSSVPLPIAAASERSN